MQKFAALSIMKTNDKKLRSELFDDLVVFLNEAKAARVFSLVRELVSERLDAESLDRASETPNLAALTANRILKK